MNKFLVLVCIFASIIGVYNKPTIKSGLRQCFKQNCPENTFACEKSTRVSEDKKQIVSNINCLGLRGDILKKLTTHEDNPFGPETEFEGYSYTGAFEISVDDDDSKDSRKETNGNKFSSTTGSPKSEIEDLNSR